jgi:hypothetical protein
MKPQHWAVTRRQVGHPAAERRWDRAYRLLLSAPAADPDAPPAGAPEENHRASSPLRPRVDEAPSPGADR